MTKNVKFVNMGGEEPEADTVEVVRNRYTSDPPASVASEDDLFDDENSEGGNGGGRRDDSDASGEYEPGFFVEGEVSDWGGAIEARSGRMELYSGPPAAVPDEIVDEVKGGLVIGGNALGREVLDVVENVTERSSLDEALDAPGASKVLSIRNAMGQEFAVVLIATDTRNGAMGSTVYERLVFFDGRQVPEDYYMMPDFSDFDPAMLDSTLIAEMFKEFGRLMGSEAAVLGFDCKMWLGAFDGTEGDIEGMAISDLIEALRMDFSELNRVDTLLVLGQFFAKMMPDTPMHNMITHMVQGPCRDMGGAISGLMEVEDGDELRRYLKSLHRHTVRLEGIAAGFLPLIAKYGVNPHPVKLSEVADKLVQLLGDKGDLGKLEVDIDPEIVGVFSEAFLLPIIENAAFNAFKFGGDVRVTGEVVEGTVYLRIHDNAPDMPEAIRGELFNRAVSPEQPVLEGVSRGTGTGSFTAGKIIRDMQVSSMPHAKRFGIDFVQKPGLKYFELRMPAYDYEQAEYLQRFS